MVPAKQVYSQMKWLGPILPNFSKVLNASDVGWKRLLYFQMRGWLTIQGPVLSID